MADELDPKILAKALTTERWSVLTRSGLDLATIATWDPALVRKPRLLVPIDVQALYIPKGHDEKFVRIPLALTTPHDEPPEETPPPFKPGKTREHGVHLQWAIPDALMSGAMSETAQGVEWLSALANRWVVLRIIAPKGGDKTVVRGWIVEADTSRVFDLEDWFEGAQGGTEFGQILTPEELNSGAGGSLNWTVSYDATLNRFALHDKIEDIEDNANDGVFNDLATYVVAGWWSEQSLDPLDPATSAKGLQERLAEMKWTAPPDSGSHAKYVAETALKSTVHSDLGLEEKKRVDLVEIDGASIATERISQVGSAEVFLPDGTRFVATEPKHTYSTLLHGQIHGVPIAGPVVADRRPDPDRIEVAVGTQIEDVLASFAVSGLGINEPAQKRQAERLLNALASDTMSRIGEPNGVVDIEDKEHLAGFSSTPGDDGRTERILDRGGPENLIAGRQARTRQNAVQTATKTKDLATQVTWTGRKRGKVGKSSNEDRKLSREWEKTGGRTPPKETAARIVRRPGPRYHQPIEPLIGIRNLKRTMRQRNNGKGSTDGTLSCRWPSQVSTSIGDIVDGAKLLGSFSRGAIPSEVLRLAQNAVAYDPYIGPWTADAAAKDTGLNLSNLQSRINAEAALRYSVDGVYDGAVPAFRSGKGTQISPQEAQIGDQLRRFSMSDGVDADPVAVTAWAQPWLPLWLEWEVELHLSDRLDGWSLGAVDLDTKDTKPGNEKRKIIGRSPINLGAARTLVDAIDTWIELEDARDEEGEGEADDEVGKRLERIVGHLRNVDMASSTLNGVIDDLLGLPKAPDGQVQELVDGEIQKLKPEDLPKLLYSGRLRLVRARVVDTFGRILDLDPTRALYPARDALSPPDGMVLRPRLSRPARWNFRFADPADVTELPRLATIDQAQPELMINPISGYLLPDLIDEALEVFNSDGDPVGQLMHEPISGGVAWEIAPGREGPADAGPLFGLEPAHLPLGKFAAAMVESDAKTRHGLPIGDTSESALSAFLRAVDTTLWTVDTFASLGTPHIAGLVGRPMAVVRATLRLQINDDLDELNLSSEGAPKTRSQVYDELSDRGFPVRIGELTRDDDGLYGFFVNDDFSRFHLVDKLVKNEAFVSGQRRGHFSQLGKSGAVPDVKPILHPFIVADDELVLHPDQIVRLTLLMHPAGKVHLTTGILPRKSLQLMRDWTETGLSRIAPSARIGPVLIDADKVRLPRIASFGKNQLWTRRDTAFTWRDDPILAATQTALLPDAPAQVEEGYIRIAPVQPQEETG